MDLDQEAEWNLLEVMVTFSRIRLEIKSIVAGMFSGGEDAIIGKVGAERSTELFST